MYGSVGLECVYSECDDASHRSQLPREAVVFSDLAVRTQIPKVKRRTGGQKAGTNVNLTSFNSETLRSTRWRCTFKREERDVMTMAVDTYRIPLCDHDPTTD